jgi:hypothetical protein
VKKGEDVGEMIDSRVEGKHQTNHERCEKMLVSGTTTTVEGMGSGEVQEILFLSVWSGKQL